MTGLSPTNKNLAALGPTSNAGIRGRLLKTGQTTTYAIGDDGSYQSGLPKSYSILTTGQFAGTTNIDVPHYAAATLTFAAADDSITDAAAGLVTFLSADTIVIHGSASNDGVYTIAAGTGGVAGHFHVNEPLADEAAGAYVTICKRSTPSNNCVIDNITGLMWRRTTTADIGIAEPVGIASDGLINWYDTATCFTLHPAAGDLQMMVDRIKIVGGAAELSRYYAGQILDCAGFANAVNNLPGYRVTSVTVNGADLDIQLWDGNNTLIAEAAAGARDIRVVCRSGFAYVGAMNAIGFAGYIDWRIPDITELMSLINWEVATAMPDAVAFPTWYNSFVSSSTNSPIDLTKDVFVNYANGYEYDDLKTTPRVYAFVRG